MKKTLLLSLILLSCTGIYAQNITVDRIVYTLNPSDNTATVYSGKNCAGNVIIPKLILDGDIVYHVTSIGEQAFAYCQDITAVIIPNSVTSIGKEAFSACSGLTAVIIPNSVTRE